MSRRRRIQYIVQNTGKSTSIWWIPGRGWGINAGDLPPGSRNMKFCRTKQQAIRHCDRINELGGKGLILMRFYRKGVRLMRNMWVSGFKPWT